MDLGLPSGTLWLDRPLGAKSVGGIGQWYQWGALVGYESATEFDFSLANYEEQGLDLIHNTLTTEQDAAAVYYGGTARIPLLSQLNELIDNTTISISDSAIILSSNINGNIIKIRPRGEVVGHEINRPSALYVWSRDFISESSARVLRIDSDGVTSFRASNRYYGVLILPVKSS